MCPIDGSKVGPKQPNLNAKKSSPAAETTNRHADKVSIWEDIAAFAAEEAAKSDTKNYTREDWIKRSLENYAIPDTALDGPEYKELMAFEKKAKDILQEMELKWEAEKLAKKAKQGQK